MRATRPSHICSRAFLHERSAPCAASASPLLSPPIARFHLLGPTNSTTAVPNLIRYGGTLKDVPAPDSATLGVTFAIYKQQDGGAPVWMETQNVTPDAAAIQRSAGQHHRYRLAERSVLARGAALAGGASARTSRASACASGERALCLQGARGRDAGRTARIVVSASSNDRTNPVRQTARPLRANPWEQSPAS